MRRRGVDHPSQKPSDGRAVVVGLSLGGYVAMAVAAREPDRVRGLVLTGATIEPVGLAAPAYRAFADDPRRGRGRPVRPAQRLVLPRRFPPAIADPIIAGGFWPRGGAMALRAIAGERFIPRLAAYPGRTLLLNGELDLPFRTGAPAFAAAARDARRVRLAGASHLANLDRPGRLQPCRPAVRGLARGRLTGADRRRTGGEPAANGVDG